MNLVETYLTQTGQSLPEALREDVIAELRALIEEQLAEQAESTTATEDEQRAVLNRFGHPLRVAASFLPQNYLIGPALFPIYIHMLRFVVMAFVVLYVLVSLFQTGEGGFSYWRLLYSGCEGALVGAVIVTGVFVAIEFSGERINVFSRWDANHLNAQVNLPLRFGEQFTNLVTEGVFLLVWNGLLPFASSAPVEFAQIVVDLYWLVNSIVLALFVLHLWLALAGRYTRTLVITEALLTAAACVVLVLFLLDDVLIVFSEHVPNMSDQWLQMTFKFVLLNIGAVMLWELYKLLRALRG